MRQAKTTLIATEPPQDKPWRELERRNMTERHDEPGEVSALALAREWRS